MMTKALEWILKWLSLGRTVTADAPYSTVSVSVDVSGLTAEQQEDYLRRISVTLARPSDGDEPITLQAPVNYQ